MPDSLNIFINPDPLCPVYKALDPAIQPRPYCYAVLLWKTQLADAAAKGLTKENAAHWLLQNVPMKILGRGYPHLEPHQPPDYLSLWLPDNLADLPPSPKGGHWVRLTIWPDRHQLWDNNYVDGGQWELWGEGSDLLGNLHQFVEDHYPQEEANYE